ncbi:MAG: carboxypeptidase regulatory-like domain-containing protein [Planctomycetes bacterium]|nr:carboxypeptidase regulatory-like domain-containing protein [Planctomycetota bacterium]
MTHPDPESLMAYAHGWTEDIAEHADSCPTCGPIVADLMKERAMLTDVCQTDVEEQTDVVVPIAESRDVWVIRKSLPALVAAALLFGIAMTIARFPGKPSGITGPASENRHGGLAGHILDASGHPVAGALVFITADPGLQKITDPEGKFHFSEAETKKLFEKATADKPWNGVDLVAVAKGFGIAWLNVRAYGTIPSEKDLDAKAARTVTLLLVEDDVPIRGQIVNSEGEPIANVNVDLGQVLVLPKNDLSRWLNNWETSIGKNCWVLASQAFMRYLPVRRRYLPDKEPPVPMEPVLTTGVTTDKEGRFELRGVGRERIAWLRLTHPEFASKTIFVATRNKFRLAPLEVTLPPLHPATFVQALEPAKPVHGVVREHGTSKPLAGAVIYMSMQPTKDEAGVSRATTAADGKFHVRGLGDTEKYRVVVVSGPGQPHLRHEFWVDASPNPLDLEIELFRGTVVKGTVRNKVTGQPIFGADLTYFPAPNNSHLEGLAQAGDGVWDQRFTTDRDGNFDLAIPPGPGLIGVRAMFDGGSIRFRDCTKEDFPTPLETEDGECYFKSATGQIVRPEDFHAVVEVNPLKGGPPTRLFIELKPK